MGSSRDSDVRKAVMIFSSEEDMSDIREFLKKVDVILRRDENTDGKLVVSKETVDGSYPDIPDEDSGIIQDEEGDDSQPYLSALREARDMAEGYLIEPDFLTELKANDLGESTLRNYRVAVESLSFLGKDPREMDKTDLVKWSLMVSDKYAESTGYSYRLMIKRYFRWLETGKLNEGDYPDCVEWIKTDRPGIQLKKVLSREEVEKMAETADKQRDRTMVRVGYESGARPGELLGLELGNIEFDQHGAQIMVDGKTGMRKIRLVESVPDLEKWLEEHPKGEDPNARLCWSQKGGSIARHTWSRILKKLASRVGMEKRVYPHLLRHSRATHLVEEGLSEAQLKKIFGWSENSDMPSVYVNLSGRDADEAILDLYETKSDSSG